nr:hypothetical protein [Tanacetum cinerariifolium]
MKEKGNPCIFVRYATQWKGYRVYNKRTILIFESIHIKFKESNKVMMSDDNTSCFVPQRQKVSDYNNSSSAPHLQKTYVHKSTEIRIQDKNNESSGAEAAESSSRKVDTLNMHTFYQRRHFDYHWNKDHLLEQFHRNPSNLVQTRQKLAKNPKMCMFALTVSTAEPKNIKEAMADHAWIKEIQEELHRFDILNVWELVDKPLERH